jgi:hypothetical protein
VHVTRADIHVVLDVVHGLAGNPKHNGQRGVVLGWGESKGRTVQSPARRWGYPKNKANACTTVAQIWYEQNRCLADLESEAVELLLSSLEDALIFLRRKRG